MARRAVNAIGVNYSRLTPIALAGLCALVACTPGDGAAGAGGRGTPAAAEGTPSPTGLSPKRYRAELNAAIKPVRSRFASLAKTRTVDKLDGRLERTQEAITRGVDRLRDIDPPPEAAAEHTRYVDRLEAVGRRLDQLTGSVADRSLCSSSALLNRLGAKVLDDLKAAAKRLNARGDYDARAIDVKVPKRRNRRLANGTLIRNGGRGGRAYLRIRNGLSHDAVVTLVRGKSRVLSVYVRKNKSYQINGVRDGTYRIYFTTGDDWDGSARTFTRNCDFSRFEDPVRFQTFYTGGSIQWQNWSLTLHPVLGGNARTRSVRPGDFPT
jgi:hypothetical protein